MWCIDGVDRQKETMDLAHFLVVAKSHTYPGGGRAVQLTDGSKELAYEQSEWYYREVYPLEYLGGSVGT